MIALMTTSYTHFCLALACGFIQRSKDCLLGYYGSLNTRQSRILSNYEKKNIQQRSFATQKDGDMNCTNPKYTATQCCSSEGRRHELHCSEIHTNAVLQLRRTET